MTHQHDSCGCFPDGRDPAPRPANPPGLDAVAYRIARHPRSLARMLAGLTGPGRPAGLAALTTRETDDPAIGLLDAAALVADVLSFYSERIANEGFLRTATERLSILELAREIGYELGPGLAAEAWLAFGVEDRASDPSRPAEATVPAGTRVQSLPAAGGLPQTFETAAELAARAAWNELRLVTSAPQDLAADTQTIYLAGTSAGVAEGDVLLLALSGPTGSVVDPPKAHLAHRVTVEGALGRTRVELAPAAAPARVLERPHYLPGAIAYGHAATLTGGSADALVGVHAWSEQGLSTLLAVNAWEPAQLVAFYTPRQAQPPDLGPADPGIYAFRSRAAIFGHNAPRHEQLTGSMLTAFPKPWDDAATRVDVTTDSQGSPIGDSIRLDTTYRVTPGGWVILTAGSADAGVAFRVESVSEPSLADFAVTGKVTELGLQSSAGGSPSGLSAFVPRRTTVYAGSVHLDLAEVPLPATLDAGATRLDLDRLVLGLDVGRPVAITGDRDDLPGTRATEVVELTAIEHAGGRTTLTVAPALQFPYVRSTIVINANVVRATHGETVAREVLGSGTGRADQQLRLRRPPVTYTGAPTGTGAESTLEVRVDGVHWDEAASLVDAGPRDERYVTHRADDGTTTVIFGDGVNGARPPSGAENVVARYRTGIGLGGQVGPGSLTLLAARPPGIRDVTNPVAAGGAQDPEPRDAARANAPLTVATLGRIVALSDYEDFARAFGGIGKALGTQLWRGEHRAIHLTVAGPGGAGVPSRTLENLRRALDDARDPGIPVEIAGHVPILVRVGVDILIDPRLEPATVIARVRAALATALGFERRPFATALTESEVIAAVIGVPGVGDTRVLALHPVVAGIGDPAQPRQDPIVARPARWTGTGLATAPAELVVLEPAGATVTERAS